MPSCPPGADLQAEKRTARQSELERLLKRIRRPNKQRAGRAAETATRPKCTNLWGKSKRRRRRQRGPGRARGHVRSNASPSRGEKRSEERRVGKECRSRGA